MKSASISWSSSPFFLRLLFLVLMAGSANAQTSDADRARLLRSQTELRPPSGVSSEGVEQGYAAASPNDTDLGDQEILKRVEKYDPFTLETGVPIYYTSNVALVDRGTVGDVIIAPVVGLTYAPRFTRTLYGEFTLRQQFFYYGEFADFNFASFDAQAGLVYSIPKWSNLILRARLDYNRLTGTDNFDDFFSNYSLFLSGEVPIPVGRAQQISFGASADISLYANPEPPRRNDFNFFFGYTANLTRSFSLDAATTLAVHGYSSGGRTDVSEILALSANYRVREFLTLSAISTLVANQSNHSVFDYQVFNIGGAIALSWRF